MAIEEAEVAVQEHEHEEHREDLIEGLDEPAGATTMLLEAQEVTTLFI